ncbi:DUF2798 domain-containing protein [Shewanella saliphila]|uniref:DUF2798 domain-containing protein n=1 Tax=Shewanella saliphila TaxID=2282698 RepID=A0ABQ2Q9H2_9GAMM|nr:DUF2798 domain-containing protein [Shewanella saliphila]MCL1100913.1 DUF2798 domain-containing protein [Shewanella saliphila]GGP57765.1 hypothetical protein GCM10009409_24750 [Shewanella saliphila]
MKKLNIKYKYPLMVSMVLPTMLLSMPAIIVYKNLPIGGSFLSLWLETIAQVVPTALILLVIVAPTVRLFVTKVLIEHQ